MYEECGQTWCIIFVWSKLDCIILFVHKFVDFICYVIIYAGKDYIYKYATRAIVLWVIIVIHREVKIIIYKRNYNQCNDSSITSNSYCCWKNWKRYFMARYTTFSTHLVNLHSKSQKVKTSLTLSKYEVINLNIIIRVVIWVDD